MAQPVTPRVATIVGIPATVEYLAPPCKWEIKPHSNVWESQAGVRIRPKRFFESYRYPPVETLVRSVKFEAWQVREEFLSLKTDEQFLDFLNRVGRFVSIKVYGWSVTGEGKWDADDFKSWQQMFRECLRRSPASWDQIVEDVFGPKTVRLVRRTLFVSRRFTVLFRWKDAQQREWRSSQHIAVLEARDVVTAILATIYVDHLHGTKFGFCHRHDCRMPYKIESKHNRKYCSQYCAHLESLRRMRERQREARGNKRLAR
jgi:hypothetical protein